MKFLTTPIIRPILNCIRDFIGQNNRFRHVYTLAALCFLSMTMAIAQPPCTNTTMWPSSVVNAPNSGGGEEITINAENWAGDFAVIGNVKQGKDYEFTNSLNYYITVRDAVNPTNVIGHGPAPLTITAGTDNDLQIHYNLNDLACGVLINVVSTTTVLCPTCPPNECSFAETTSILSYGECDNITTIILQDCTTSSGQASINCPDASNSNDLFYSWTATTSHLVWDGTQAGTPGIVIWNGCATEVTCAVENTQNTLSGWNIGDNLIFQLYNDQTDNQTILYCLADACGDAGNPLAPHYVCNNSATAINLFSQLIDEDAGGSWTETSATTSSNGAFDAVTAMFTAENQLGGTYTFQYTAPGPCMYQSTVTIEVIPQPYAGDGPGSVALYTTDAAVNLLSLLPNADMGGTWTETSGMTSTGFTAGTGAFDPSSHAFGIFTFEYTVSAAPTGECSGSTDTEIVTVRVRIANDDCDGAIAIPINATCINFTGNNFNATDSRALDGAPNACAGYDNSSGNEKDVWYTVELSAGQIVEITGSVVTGSAFPDADMAIYSGNCGALVGVNCQDGNGSGFEPYYVLENDTGQAQSYIIRYWSWPNNEGEFNICIVDIPPASNDDCPDAIMLTANGMECIIVTANNIGATASELTQTNIPSPTCGDYQGGDVWFETIVAPNTFIKIEPNGNNIGNIAMAIYSNTCSMLVLEDCSEGNELVYENSTASAQLIYIRLWSFSNANSEIFDICVREIATPPSNYICSSAISMNVGMGTSCSAVDLISATTLNAIEGGGCSRPASKIVWYSFMSNANADPVMIDVSNILPIESEFADLSFLAYLRFSSGLDCENLNFETCGDATLFQFTPPDPNQQYWLEVGVSLDNIGQCNNSFINNLNEILNSGFTFDICAYSCVSPSNDNIATPLVLPSDPIVCREEEDNFCAIDDIVFYSYTPEISSSYTLSGQAFSPNVNLGISVVEQSAGVQVFGSNQLCVNLEAGTDYLLVFDIGQTGSMIREENQEEEQPDEREKLSDEKTNSNFGGGPTIEFDRFSFCIEQATIFVCETAKELSFCCNIEFFGCYDLIVPPVFNDDSEEASKNAAGGCVPFSTEQWYKITVPSSGALNVSMYSEASLGFEVYEGKCDNLSFLSCTTGSGNSWSSSEMNPGSTLYFKVEVGDNGPFDICVNDNGNPCPEQLILAGSFTGNTILSTANDASGVPDGGLISSTQVVEATAIADYNAGSEVLLNPDFEVKAGAVFHAYIDGCDTIIFDDIN